MSLMRMLREAGYPERDFDHHESDLYVYKTPLTTKVIDAWLEGNDFASPCLVSEFTDGITGVEMYEIAFQYDPYWKERVQQGENLVVDWEFEYLLKFAREGDFENRTCVDQLIALWTAFCLHKNLDVDTYNYDWYRGELYAELRREKAFPEMDSPRFMDGFQYSMCRYLV